jgi:hypothetical protein
LAFITGKVTFQWGGQTGWSAATVGDFANGGVTFQVPKGTLVGLRFPCGQVVVIEGPGFFTYQEPACAPTCPRNVSPWVELKDDVSIIYNGLRNIGHEPSIETPTDVNAVRGTSYQVQVLSDNSTFVQVFNGTVSVTNKISNATVTLSANQQVIVPNTGVSQQNLTASVKTFDPSKVNAWWEPAFVTPTNQQVMSMVAQPPPSTILEIVAISTVASSLLFFFDRANGVAFMEKKHGSRLVKWFLPMVIFIPLAYWVTTIALTWVSGVLSYVELSLFVGFTSGAWLAWVPIFVYAGATNGSAGKKIGWVVKVWLRGLVLGIAFVLVGLSLLFVNSAGISNADISYLISRLLLLGSSAGGAFLSLTNISSIIGLILEFGVLGAAFGASMLIKRSRNRH